MNFVLKNTMTGIFCIFIVHWIICAEINVPSINNDIFLDSTKTDKDTQHGCLTDCVTVSNDADMLGMRKIVDSKTRRKRDTRRFIRSPQSDESVRLSKQQQQDGVCQFASTGSYPQEWQSEPYKSRLDKSPIWDNGDRRIRQICGGTRVFRPEPNNAMYSLFKQYLLNEYNYTNQNSEFDSVCYIPPEETDTVETSSSRPPATRPTSQVPPVQPPTDICYCDEETAIERLWRIITFRY
ncbi:uncharacterized protein LOC119661135 isoform X2 [Hermetia illucens]|uniref:uncharacterized protein LOC119661135 isoform X2 n=1 Tax=Hermetia illucens TaxID=343691 RepID=UPI0018CC309E|nr:uncharacterized protein LOC119661135 isoform X2 [Hermetia illucens]